MNGDDSTNRSRRGSSRGPRPPGYPNRRGIVPSAPAQNPNMPPTGGMLPMQPEYPTPMNALDRLRAQALALTGGRSGDVLSYPGLQGRRDDFRNEVEIRSKTNQKVAIPYVPKKTPARDACGPPINVNLTQLTSDAKGQVNTSEWMHDWWGHACGCGEDT